MIETVVFAPEYTVMRMKAGGWIVVDTSDREQHLGKIYVYDVTDEMVMAEYPSISCNNVIGRVVSVHYDL